MKNERCGAFIISLDFELFWGVADIASIELWEEKIKKVYEIVPRTLALFKQYGIHATWATVAGIMVDNENELYKYIPKNLPEQTKKIIDKFDFEDKHKCIPAFMLFGKELVEMVRDTEGQEIGTHTFTHYYCDKKDSNPEDFYYELQTACMIMENKGYGECRSVVFPRNQVSQQFVSAMPKDIKAYRGPIPGYIDKLKKKHKRIGTIVWYLDHYLPLQDSTFFGDEIDENEIYNVKLSRLFKAYKKKYSFAEKMKIWRYKREMEHAAKNGKIYHICWHPHNFSTFTDKNFEQLEELLKKYNELREKYGMLSINMAECTKHVK